MIIFYELGKVFENFGQFLFLENLKKKLQYADDFGEEKVADEGSTHVELFDPKRRVEPCLFPRPHPSRLFPFGHSTRVISYPSHGRSFSRMYERRRNGNGGRHLRAKWRRYVPRAHLSLWHKSRNSKHMACICMRARAYLYMYVRLSLHILRRVDVSIQRDLRGLDVESCRDQYRHVSSTEN